MVTARHRVLLAGASAIALVGGSLSSHTVRAASLNTLVSTGAAGRTTASSGLAGAQALNQQVTAAAAATKQSLQDMMAAASAISAQAAAQASARLAASGTEPAVPDGLSALAAKGLAPATNLDTTIASSSNGLTDTGTGIVWYGANAPVQTQSGSQYTVTVTQTSAKAILTWTNFDIGQNTTLVFNQKVNGVAQHDWIALNRIVGNSTSPSMILGKIQADGQVYIINQNGVIFGGTSQINVNSLVVSSLDIDSFGSTGANTQTLANRNNAFLSTSSSVYGVLQLAAAAVTNANGTTTYQEGDITVQAGAEIETPLLSTTDPYLGQVLLAAANVTNAGTISSPDGQVVLVSASNLVAAANNTTYTTAAHGGTPDVDPNVRGIDLFSLNTNSATASGYLPGSESYTNPGVLQTSTVTNTGLIQVPRGNITIEANDIEQDGVLETTTSVKENGSIYLTPLDLGVANSAVFYPGSINFGSGSVVAVLPDTALNVDGTVPTIPEDSITTAGYLPSVIEITLPAAYEAIGNTLQSTGSVTLQSGSLIEAPAANVTFYTPIPTISAALPPTGATPNLVIDSGAAIDVAGLTAIQHSVSDNIINVSRVGLNELANSPLQRNGPIYTASVNIDVRLGTPLFDASGYISEYALTAQDLAANGGTVTIGAAAGDSNYAKGTLVQGVFNPSINSYLISAVTAFQAGAVINADGGYTTYSAGYLDTTKLVTANGSAIVDISQASPNVIYAGIAGSYSYDHTRWGVTTTYNDLLFVNSAGTYDPGYIQGGNAGTVTIGGFAKLGGTIDAAAVQGTYQRAGSGIYASAPPTRGTIDLSYLDFDTIEIEAQTPTTAAPAASDGSLSFNSLLATTVGADFLNNSGAGTIKLAAYNAITLDPDTAITLAPGTSLTLASAAISIGAGAGITDPSGAITLSLNNAVSESSTASVTAPSQFLTVGDNAVLDVAGNWVNDSGATPGTLVGSDYVNGGSISIISTQQDTGTLAVDQVSFGAGAVLDLDGGGYVTTAGHLAYGSNGLPLGKGGSLTIALHQLPQPITYSGSSLTLPIVNGVEQIDDSLTFDPTASLSAYGLGGGGTFTLQGPEITVSQAGNTILPTTVGATGQFDVSTAFLKNAGFGAYNLIAETTGQITAGTEVELQQLQFLPTENAASATSLAQAVTLGMNSGVLRPATNFSFSALGWIDGAAAAFDPVNENNVIKNQTEYGTPAGFGYDIASNALTVGQGATITADPGASISLSASGSLNFDGSITAPGGTIRLSQTNDYTAYYNNISTYNVDYFGTMVLGPNAVLNAAGTLVTDPRQQTYLAGSVLPGGSVTISATEVNGETGSQISVAGASGTLDLPVSVTLDATKYQAETVTSDGGTIVFTGAADPTVGRNGLIYGFIDTALYGASGGGTSAGGTLDIVSDILSIPEAHSIPAGDLNPTIVLKQGLDGAHALVTVGLSFPAGRIDAGDFDVVSLSVFDETSLKNNDLLTLGTVDVTSGRLLEVTGFNVKMGGKNAATLSAPYIEWLGDGAPATTSTLTSKPTASLTIEASNTLEIGGDTEFNGVGLLTLSASQIAFVPDTSSTSTDTVTNYSGEIVSTGNVTLNAGTVFPSTATSFTIETTGSINFANTGGIAPIAPLSVGGTFSVEAANISAGQGATIAAPYGQINLGALSAPVAGDPYFAPTANVTLASGSLVTVSGADQYLPYGQTQDLQTWLYGELGTITSPPAKAIAIDANTANVASGAKVDLSGGGDIFAYEFITGLGGTNNVLSAAPTSGFSIPAISKTSVTFAGAAVANAPDVITITLPNGSAVVYTTTNSDTPATLASRVAALVRNEGVQASVSGGTVTVATGVTISASITGYTGTVYAIVPGVTGKQSAPVDLAGYADTSNLADPAFGAIGQTLTLAQPADGLAAGTYLLLPVAYANLPGAIRVEIFPGATGIAGNVAQRGLDGTVTIAGTLGFGGSQGVANGSRNSEDVEVSLQTAPVWNQYSQINITSGNQYFAALATSNGAVVPPLPIDAGQLTIDVASSPPSLALDGTLDFSVGSGGRGGQLFIGASAIEVVSNDQTSDPGYLVLTPAEITSLNAPRITLGAIGQTTSTGENLDVIAQSIIIRTDASDPLVNPSITLAATGSITVESHSVIDAEGPSPGSTSRTINIGAVGGASGDGALIRVSNGGPVTVVRANVDNQVGTITFGDSVVIGGDSSIGGAASIEINGTAAVTIPVTSSITGAAISIAGQEATFTAGSATTGGAQFSKLGSLAEATSLSIEGYQQIVFDTPLDLSTPASGSGLQDLTLDTPSLIFASTTGGDVSIASSVITLTNSSGPNGAASPPSGIAIAPSGTLMLNAGQTLNLGGNGEVVYGFNHVVATAGTSILTGAAGTTGTLLLAGSDLAATTPLITAANGSFQTIQASGTIALSAPSTGPAAVSTSNLGGHVAFVGQSITVGTDISAVGGEIDLTAQGAAGIALTGFGSLHVPGYTQQFLSGADGTEIVLPGGTVQLTADTGGVALAPSSLIDISAAPNGNAGDISIAVGSPTSILTLGGTLLAQSGGVATSGGSFLLDSVGAVDLTALAPLLVSGGFTNSVSVESGIGNLVLNQTLTARQVLLSADDASGNGGGQVILNATVDASGNAADGEGGTVQIYGASGVTLAPGVSILAVSTDPTQRGGQVTIGVGIDANGKSGILDLAAGSTINVSADGRYYGSDASTILFRTPFVNADGVTAWTGGAGASSIAAATVLDSMLVGVTIMSDGLPTVTLEPYQRVDVTKLYAPDAAGVSTINNWTPIFTQFAPQTSALAAKYAGAAVMPGLELDDGPGTVADPSGTIKITADLDLAATTTQLVTASNGKPYLSLVPEYRYGDTATTVQTNVSGGNPINDGFFTQTLQTPTMPGILSIRAAGDIDIDATISDGFTYTTNKAEPDGSDLNAAANLERQGSVTENLTATVTFTSGKNTLTKKETITSTYSLNPLVESWSYQFIAGARFNNGGLEGGDPTSIAQVATFESGALANRGNVVVGAPPTLGAADPGLDSVLVRTGTGSIGIYAGGQGVGAAGVAAILSTLIPQEQQFDAAAGFTVSGDAAVMILNPGAAIYTAGYDANPATPTATAEGFPGITYAYSIGEAGKIYESAGNHTSDNTFINPVLIGANWNSPSFDTLGGDITISAPHGSIVAQQNFHDIILNSSGNLDPTGQTLASDHTLLTGDHGAAVLSGGAFSNIGETSNYWLNGQETLGGGDPAIWVETGMFREGVGALGGGDVNITAGGDIRNLSASIVSTSFVEQPQRFPTTIPAAVNNGGYGYGGGNLTLTAGNDIRSVVTEVEQGNTTVNAGGGILSDFTVPQNNSQGTGVSSVPVTVGSSFTWANGSVAVFSRGAIDSIAANQEAITGLQIDEFVPIERSAYTYYDPKLANSLSVVAEGGDLIFTDNTTDVSYSNSSITVTPPTVTLASITGSIDITDGLAISPSANSNLDILAADNVSYSAANTQLGSVPSAIQFIDVDPSLIQSPTNTGGLSLSTVGANGNGYYLDYTQPYTGQSLPGQTNYTLHDPTLLHANDTQPFRIIALTGNIETGIDPTGAVDTTAIVRNNSGNYSFGPEDIYADKPGIISAGRDIINMSLSGENNTASDTTIVEAGRDITYTDYSVVNSSTNVTESIAAGSNFIISGPGAFDLIAGRNLNLAPSDTPDGEVLAGQLNRGFAGPSGVEAVGDGINPYLPQASAELNILFGVSPGIDTTGFVAAYLNPATAGAYAATYDPLLQSYVQSTEGLTSTPSVASALTTFDGLASQAQLPFLEQVLFAEIRNVSNPANSEYNDFALAYKAIDALFPASYGYSDNLTAKHTLVPTGNFNMTNAVVSTRYTSDINVLGPGGGATVGGLSALGNAGNVIPVSEQGILAITGGNINALVDTNFNVFASRVLALDGGEVTIASTNGSIDAGRGKKTVSLVPPLTVAYTPNLSAYVAPAGQITGSGIGTLVTIPGQPQAPVYLLAPNGDIDAGDAGIRASGNLFIVALEVLNADNIQVGGKAVGIPTTPTVSVNALNVANTQTSATTSVNHFDNRNAPTAQQVPSIITVEVLGFGEVDAEPSCVNAADPNCQPGKAAR